MSALYDKYAYTVTYTNSGYKGESLVSRVLLSTTMPPVFPDFIKGKGNNFTGGGGGNGRFSGGAGGAETWDRVEMEVLKHLRSRSS